MNTALATCRDWDFLFVNALLEPDTNRLQERISAAENAINDCLKSITSRSHDDPEKIALMDALRALHILRVRRTQIA